MPERTKMKFTLVYRGDLFRQDIETMAPDYGVELKVDQWNDEPPCYLVSIQPLKELRNEESTPLKETDDGHDKHSCPCS